MRNRPGGQSACVAPFWDHTFVTFISLLSLFAQKLAYNLNSLARVSRRDGHGCFFHTLISIPSSALSYKRSQIRESLPKKTFLMDPSSLVVILNNRTLIQSHFIHVISITSDYHIVNFRRNYTILFTGFKITCVIDFCCTKTTFFSLFPHVRFTLVQFQVLENISLSLQSAFQLSFAVLVYYRSTAPIFSLGWNSPPFFSLHYQADLLFRVNACNLIHIFKQVILPLWFFSFH